MGEVIGPVVVTGVLVLGALLVRSIGRAAARGTLDPNQLAGMRTSATMSSPEAWQAGHRAAQAWTDVATDAGLVVAVVRDRA